MDGLPLGDVLARALDAREAAAQAITPPAPTTQVTRASPPTKPSLFTLAKSENATSYIAQRRRDAERASRR